MGMRKLRMDRLPVPSDRTIQALKWILAAAVVLFVAWLIYAVATVNDRADLLSNRLETAQSERADLRQVNAEQDEAIAARDEALSEANDRLADQGESPVTVPEEPVTVPEPSGRAALTSSDVLALIRAEVNTIHPDLSQAQRESIVQAAAVAAAKRLPEPEDGQDGPTLAQMRPVIAAEVAKIPTPEDGQDGRTPTPEEVTAAIRDLCGGTCRGAQGAPGPAGPAGTAGPPGVQGQPGEDGEDGRGITSVACTDTGQWVITYTDGATEQVEGPCRVTTPEPEPEPTSTSGSPPSPEPSGTG